MRLLQAALDTCLDSPFFASLSVHGLHFTVCAPSIRIQWNAGTACVSECVLKTLACRGLRVGPSKPKSLKGLPGPPGPECPKKCWKSPRTLISQRALRDILMPRGKNWLPIVSRQLLTRNYPHLNCLLKGLPNCLPPECTKIAIFCGCGGDFHRSRKNRAMFWGPKMRDFLCEENR